MNTYFEQKRCGIMLKKMAHGGYFRSSAVMFNLMDSEKQFGALKPSRYCALHHFRRSDSITHEMVSPDQNRPVN